MRRKNHRSNSSFFVPNSKYLEAAFKVTKIYFDKIKFIKFYLIWLLLTIALADPNIRTNKKQINVEGYDLMILVDVSNSMSALDFSTRTTTLTRLDISKQVISNFIKQRTYDRIGLIIFGQYAYLDSPLTYDKTAINSILNSTEIGMAGSSTAIGDALALAIKTLQHKEKNSRAIILLTDGENNSGIISPEAAAKISANYQIPIYTIGIGKNEEAPFINSFGQLEYHFIALDSITLKNIANLTKGKFYTAENKEELNNIYNEIDSLTKTKFAHNAYYSYKAIYQYFIFIALFLCLANYGFNYVRNNK
ncbi:MAG: VWA domain-containing protein [Rickettsiales bacterium]